jgi:hypothetical protein
MLLLLLLLLPMRMYVNTLRGSLKPFFAHKMKIERMRMAKKKRRQ